MEDLNLKIYYTIDLSKFDETYNLFFPGYDYQKSFGNCLHLLYSVLHNEFVCKAINICIGDSEKLEVTTNNLEYDQDIKEKISDVISLFWTKSEFWCQNSIRN